MNPARWRSALLVGVAAGVVALDQWTKSWAQEHLVLDVPRHVLGPAYLVLTYNKGAAFSFGTGASPVIAVLAVGLVMTVVFYSRRLAKGGAAWPVMVALGLLAGGAVSNLADRFFRHHHGAVVDFIQLVSWWAIFNVADAAITVGALALAASLVLSSARCVLAASPPLPRRGRRRWGAGRWPAAPHRGRASIPGGTLTTEPGAPGGTIELSVPTALEGERVDRGLALLVGLSRAEASRLVAAGGARVGGAAVRAGSRRLRAGELLEVDLAPSGPPAWPEEREAGAGGPDGGPVATIVFADDHLVVVDKPAGLVVHPGAGNRQGTLVQQLVARFADIATAGPTTSARGSCSGWTRGHRACS